MSLVDNTAERFLRIAASRWPEDLRDDQSREWAGELYAIRNDDDSGRLRRAWTQLRFGLSLAASPPVDDPNKIPKGWREIMPQLGLKLRRCLMLVGVGLLCLIGVQTLGIVSGAWTELLPDPTKTPEGLRVATTLLALALGITGAAWLGRRLGRSMPLRVRQGRSLGALASAAIVMACLMVGTTLHLLVYAEESLSAATDLLIGFAVLLPVAVLVFALAARGRTRRARWWGIGAGLVLLELVSIPVAAWNTYVGINYPYSPYAGAEVSYFDLPASLLWFPQSLIWHGTKPGGLAAELEMQRMYGLSTMMLLLLTVGAFALTYLMRSAVAEPVGLSAARRSAPAAVSRWRRQLGLTVAGVGVVVWAALLTFAVPRGVFLDEYGFDASVLWILESRNWAILLACLGLAWALSGRTRILLPSAAFGLAALAIDALVDRARFTGPGAFLVVAGIAGALTVAAWWIPTKLDKQLPDADTVRRTTVAIAVMAGYSAPVALSQARVLDADGGWQAIGLPMFTTVLTAAFAGLAGAAAISGRERSPARAAAIAIVGVPVAIMAALGLGTRFGFPGPALVVASALCVPMIVYLTAVLHWDRRERSRKDVLRWTAGGLGVTVVGVLLLYPQYLAAEVFGDVLFVLQSSERGGGGEGFAVFAGFFLGAVVYAIAIALITVRRPRREAAVSNGGQVSGEVVSA